MLLKLKKENDFYNVISMRKKCQGKFAKKRRKLNKKEK